MKYRNVRKHGFYELHSAKEEYLLSCGDEGPNKNLILFWIETILSVMYPIIPHFSEIAYLDYFLPHVTDKTKYPKYLSEYTYP